MILLNVLLYPLHLLFKGQYRDYQRWNVIALCNHVKSLAPPELRVYESGWYCWCEPFFQVDNLEWVVIERDIGGGCSISHHLRHDANPTDDELRTIFASLLRAVF